jgi:hypothetical protein
MAWISVKHIQGIDEALGVTNNPLMGKVMTLYPKLYQEEAYWLIMSNIDNLKPILSDGAKIKALFEGLDPATAKGKTWAVPSGSGHLYGLHLTAHQGLEKAATHKSIVIAEYEAILLSRGANAEDAKVRATDLVESVIAEEEAQCVRRIMAEQAERNSDDSRTL